MKKTIKTTTITHGINVFNNSILHIAEGDKFQHYIGLDTEGNWQYFYEFNGNLYMVAKNNFDWSEAAPDISSEVINTISVIMTRHGHPYNKNAMNNLSNLAEYLGNRMLDITSLSTTSHNDKEKSDNSPYYQYGINCEPIRPSR